MNVKCWTENLYENTRQTPTDVYDSTWGYDPSSYSGILDPNQILLSGRIENGKYTTPKLNACNWRSKECIFINISYNLLEWVKIPIHSAILFHLRFRVEVQAEMIIWIVRAFFPNHNLSQFNDVRRKCILPKVINFRQLFEDLFEPFKRFTTRSWIPPSRDFLKSFLSDYFFLSLRTRINIWLNWF